MQSAERSETVTVEDEGTYSTVTIRAQDGGNMLMALTGVFGMFNVSVLEASIGTCADGHILDVFRVTMPDSKPVRTGAHTGRVTMLLRSLHYHALCFPMCYSVCERCLCAYQ